MTKKLIAFLPGQKDINGQFTPTNMPNTFRLFKKLLKNDDYEFGTLTAAYNGWAPGSPEYDDWMGEIAANYPTTAQNKIKKTIIKALKHIKSNGADDPIQVILNWTTDGTKKEVLPPVYDPSIPAYTIEIVGYKKPLASLLAARPKKKKK
jgi:hypothetical protein